MLRHYAGNWLAVVSNLTRLRWVALTVHAGDTPEVEFHAQAKTILPMVTTECAELPFSLSLRRQVQRLVERINNPEGQYFVLVDRLDETLYNIQAELESHLFLCVPEPDRELFEQNQPPFGNHVERIFPGTSSDVAAAARCLALDEPTACVFHLMRVAEAALRHLADDLGVPFPVSVELENWKNIIDGIEKKIKAMAQEPKSLQKSEALQFYSAAAVQFRWFKDAWRNHVAHVRVSYTKPEAMAIFDHVRSLVRGLADAPRS